MFAPPAGLVSRPATGVTVLRKIATVDCLLVVALALIPQTASADTGRVMDRSFTPGAPGIGDPYFPTDGNGGYDVSHYGLDLKYEPADRVADQCRDHRSPCDTGPLAIRPGPQRAHGAQRHGERRSGELAPGGQWVGPQRTGDHPVPRSAGRQAVHHRDPLRRNSPNPTMTTTLASRASFPTDDGAVVIGQPHVAATWFPVNDHPADKAAYDIKITVPAGVEAISNGVLLSQRTKGRLDDLDVAARRIRWRRTSQPRRWGSSTSPAYRSNGITFLDAIDPAVDHIYDPDPQQDPSISTIAKGSFAREPEIIDFLSTVLRALSVHAMPAASWTTSTRPVSRWRTRPDRSTTRRSSTPRRTAMQLSSMSSPISGTATV